MVCPNCNTQYTGTACPNCGATAQTGPVPGTPTVVNNYYEQPRISEKNWLCALLLCLFLGSLGIHRFYSGKIGTGIIWLLTLGCLGIGALIDLIMIACGSFKDGYGLPIKNR